LPVVEVRIGAVEVDELLVRSLLKGLAVVEDHDVVGDASG
jgi:hypothetical protein